MSNLAGVRGKWSQNLLFSVLFASSLLLRLPVSGADTSSTNLPAAKTERPAGWAAPLKKEGLPNLHKVSDRLYCSAQPEAEGFKALKKMGIRTVVNLRAFHDDSGKMKGTGLAYECIQFNTWHPENEDIVKFLRIVTDTNRTPVLVHCQHGADRTGTMCAIYRIAVEGWGREDAIREMTQGSFGFHEVWDNLITFIRGLDMDKLKKDAGLK